VAINFPTSLDNFTNPSSGNTLDSPSHSLQHSDINDAVEALEAKLGVGASPAGSATSGQVLTASTGGTTTWTTPTTPGLVQVVATSVAVGSGSGSVDANGAVTFTGASSISLNGCFTSTYENYRIICDITNGSADAVIFMKMRASGSDSSTLYFQGASFTNTSGTSGSSSLFNGSNGFQLSEIDTAEAAKHIAGFNLDMNRPFSSIYTAITFFGNAMTGAGTVYTNYGGGVHAVQTSYDGLSVISSAGNITGTIRVYGYRN
jgi:hypothetical protein